MWWFEVFTTQKSSKTLSWSYICHNIKTRSYNNKNNKSIFRITRQKLEYLNMDIGVLLTEVKCSYSEFNRYCYFFNIIC